MATTDETGLRARLLAEGLAPSSWGNGPHDRYAAHEHAYDKVIVVVAGSIRFGSRGTDGGFDLEAGDRLELPAGTVHDAVVGPDGVSCLEAHVPRGTFAAPAMRPAGSW
jgi:quercetin dioxygenase-like cupin family protein